MKDSYIAAKERWARKMAGKEKTAIRSSNRLPPGQRQVHNFPVLDLGIRPEVPIEKWELKIGGLVENPVTLNWQQFLALPQFKDGVAWFQKRRLNPTPTMRTPLEQ